MLIIIVLINQNKRKNEQRKKNEDVKIAFKEFSNTVHLGK